MYIIFEKERWEEFKADTIKNASAERKVFITDFFEMIEKQGTWKELPKQQRSAWFADDE